MGSKNATLKPRTSTQGQSTKGKTFEKPRKGVPGAGGGKVSSKPRFGTQGQK